MAKKNFTVTDITATLAGATSAPKDYRNTEVQSTQPEMTTAVKNLDRPTAGKNKGLRVDEERVSFVLLSGQYEKLQAIAYWERTTLKDTVIDILEAAFAEYERKNGVIKPKPIKNSSKR